ncbi:MAG: hypothetical protein WDW36_002403 [Sanguina aurantia]
MPRSAQATSPDKITFESGTEVGQRVGDQQPGPFPAQHPGSAQSYPPLPGSASAADTGAPRSPRAAQPSVQQVRRDLPADDLRDQYGRQRSSSSSSSSSMGLGRKGLDPNRPPDTRHSHADRSQQKGRLEVCSGTTTSNHDDSSGGRGSNSSSNHDDSSSGRGSDSSTTGGQQHSRVVVVGSSSPDAPAQVGLQRQLYVRPPSRTAVLTGLITSCSSLQALVALHREGCDPWDHIHCCAALSRLAKLSGSSTHTRTDNTTPRLHGADASGESDRGAGSRDSSSSSSIPGSSSSSGSSSSGGSSSGGGMSHPDESLGSDPHLPSHTSKQGFMLQVLQQVLQPRLRARLRGREVANLIWAMAKIGWDPSVETRSAPNTTDANSTTPPHPPQSPHSSSSSSGSSSFGSSSSSSSSGAQSLHAATSSMHGTETASSCFEQLLHMACDGSHSGALWKLNPQELSNILYALATGPPPPPTTHPPTTSLPRPHARTPPSEPPAATGLSRHHDSSRQDGDSPARRSPREQRAGQVHALAAALQAGFPRTGCGGFLACSEPLLHDFTDQGLAITAVAMARLQFRPPPAWRYGLLDAVWRLLPRARSGQAAANTLWAMVAMGQAPPDAWVDACLASLATRSSSLTEEDLSNAFVAAAKTRRRPTPEAVDALLGRAYDLMPGSSLKAVASVVSALAVLQLRPSGGWMNRLLNCVYKAAAVMISSDATSSIPHSSMQQQSSGQPPSQADPQPVSGADSNQQDRRLAGTVGSGNSEIRPAHAAVAGGRPGGAGQAI